MLSWPAPLLPTLPGTGPALKVHDTALAVGFVLLVVVGMAGYGVLELLAR